MYNSNQKMSFLDEKNFSESTLLYSKSLLERVSEAEYKYGTDICCMSVPQMTYTIEKYGGTRASALNSFISMVKSYVKWCESKGIATTDSIFSIG